MSCPRARRRGISGLNTTGCAGAVMSIQIFNGRSSSTGRRPGGKGRAPRAMLVAAQKPLDLAETLLGVIVELEERLEQASERGAQRGLGGDDDRPLAGAEHERARVEDVAVLAVDVNPDLADLVQVGQDHVDRAALAGAAREVLVDAGMLE